MTRKEAIDKIKKCLALSSSSNEHEAEVALRQARKMMEEYGVEHADVLAAEAGESHAKSGATSTPASWETLLASKVADAFGCSVIFIQGITVGEWSFIGCGAAPEISRYAFDVLLRQCKRQRSEHIKTNLKRCKTSTKTRRADLFCQGWVSAVSGKIQAFVGTEKQESAIEAYIAQNYPTLRDMNSRNRNSGRNLRSHEHDDYIKGRRSGSDAQLHHGVAGEQQLALE